MIDGLVSFLASELFGGVVISVGIVAVVAVLKRGMVHPDSLSSEEAEVYFYDNKRRLILDDFLGALVSLLQWLKRWK